MTNVIIGGGLSGLSAAFYLSKLPKPQKFILLEASNRCGGWIHKEEVNNTIFEQAARSIRPRGPAGTNTLNLIDELNLEGEVVGIKSGHVAARNRMIFANGALHILPNSLLGALTVQKPFTKSLLGHILNDLRAPAKVADDDSAYEFTKRRFGPEVADYLIDTMLCGICAGSSREISVNFIMKRLFEYEQKHGGIIKGALLSLFKKKDKGPPLGLLAQKSAAEHWSMYTFKKGLDTLPIALEAVVRQKGDVRFNTKCQEISFNRHSAEVHSPNGKIQSDQIISTIPAKNLGEMVKNQHPILAQKLSNIKMVTVAVVNLLYEGNHLKFPGFGVLIPPKEKLPILGIIYDSCIHNYPNKTVLTVMMGGYWFDEHFGKNSSDEFLLKTARDHIKLILNIAEEPMQFKVNVLKDCIPQYVVGHEKNLREINDYIEDKRLPIKLCGSSYYGVGINDVILSAKNVVESLN